MSGKLVDFLVIVIVLEICLLRIWLVLCKNLIVLRFLCLLNLFGIYFFFLWL